MFEITEIIEEQTIVGNPSDFAIGYAFIGNNGTTELSLFVKKVNLLGFTKGGNHYTTRWHHLENLVNWLEHFALNMKYEPFPINVEGECAAELVFNARSHAPKINIDSTDEDMIAFDSYFDRFENWTWDHSWINERNGAILSNVYFEYNDGTVDISWDNRHPEDGVVFDCDFGSARVSADTFKAVTLKFVDTYNEHWNIESGNKHVRKD